MTVASRTSADPLGPDSLTWKYFGDLRTGMMGVWIGAIQNMYPELGAGVEEHSILLREPLQRVARSVYPIMGVVYDGDRAAQTGQQIKGYHRTIKGVDAEGRRYHALNPDTFYWAHATFFMLVIKVAEYFCGGLTEAEKHQLFEEHVRWYRMYGMSMRPVPKSWEDFQDYWDRVCRDKLEINQATVDILQMRIPKPRFVLMPTPIWDQLFKPLIAGQRWIAAGLFDPAVREKAGMHWTPGDEVLLRVFGKVVELAFLAVPDEIRLHPRALAAYRRAAGRTRHDAPLVQAPGFMAPPRDRQGLPMHYFPPRSHRFTRSALDPAKALMERAGALVHSTLSLAGVRPARGPSALRRAGQSAAAQRPSALIQTDRGRGRDVEALRPSRHQDVYAVVRQGRDLGRQPVCFGPEQPCRRLGKQPIGIVESHLAVHCGGQHLQSGRSQVGDGGTDIGRDDDRDREDATGGRAQTLAVVWVDAAPGEDHRRGTHGVGDADYRARVARLADLDGHRDQLR